MSDNPLNRLSTLLDNKPPSTVMVVGDFMLDTYIWGKSDRLSPEAPVPVVKVQSEMNCLGGAGNVVANLRGLDVEVLPFGVHGEDLEGEKIRQFLHELDCSSDMLLEIENRPTVHKTRVIAQTQQIVRIDQEKLIPLDAIVLETIVGKVGNAIESRRASVCIISDYGKGICQPSLVRRIIERAWKYQVPVIVDPKSMDFSVYANASCITPNLLETSRAAMMEVCDDQSVVKAATKLRESFQFENVLVTRGANGMTLLAHNGEAIHIPAEAREVFDVSGAGDTVVATLAAGISWGMSYEKAARLANTAAGIVVGKLGTMPITLVELQQALRTNGLNRSQAKVMSLDYLLQLKAIWQTQGKRVVFTNGCFDILHLGHITLLEKAKDLGDVLVVGLNSDASVSRLKGPGRPINSEKQRALILAGLAVVDAVVLFAEDTPLELIKAIHPDVLVKGADYQEEEVVGRDILESYGGEVSLIPLVAGHSTSDLIRKINEVDKKGILQ